MLESTFREDWDKIGSNRAKKGYLVLESTIFRSMSGVNGLKRLSLLITEDQVHECTGQASTEIENFSESLIQMSGRLQKLII